MSGTQATLIGDLVGSKRSADRRRLQGHLAKVLARANDELAPTQALEVTVGDEFQGCFASPAHAARASLVIRLALLTGEPGSDSRYGLGLGGVEVFDAGRSPISQDGPGWWAARDAIVRAERLAGSPRTEFVRTAFGVWMDETNGAGETVGSGQAAALDAALITRDALVGGMNARGLRLLLRLLRGETQSEMARQEGITQGAVSQHLARSGAFAIEAAQRRLGGGGA